jgi:hypothetical protein
VLGGANYLLDLDKNDTTIASEIRNASVLAICYINLDDTKY